MTSPDSVASNSLERSLKLLEIIGRTPGGLSNGDISRKLNIATSSTCYILKRLEREGYVTRRGDGRYGMGLKVLSLASGALRELGVHHSAAPVLHPLTHATHLSSYVGVLECSRLLVVEQVESPSFIRPENDLGTEHPADSSAMGRMLLAHLPEAELDALLPSGKLTRRTPSSTVSKSRLKKDLRQIQRAGFALSELEEFLGVRALAAPIVEKDGSVRASVAVAGPAAFPIWLNLPELIFMLHVAARDIARNARNRLSSVPI